MAQNNAINNRSSTLLVDNTLTVTAGDVTSVGGNIYVGTTTPTLGYDITIDRTVAGNMGMVIQNESNNVAATALFQMLVEPGGGDAAVNFSTNGGSSYALGIDNSDSDSFKVTTATDPSTGSVILSSTTGANTVFGSNAAAETTTLQSGSGGISIATASNGTITANSGTGTIGVSTDASATTVNIGTGGAAKTVTLGSTNTTSSLALQYGTADMTIASATGTVMSLLDTGEITMPLQSAFGAVLSADDSDVTGDGTTFMIGSGNVWTEIFDQNSDFVTTGTFTAPVTGRYQFNMMILMQQVAATMTPSINLTTSNRGYTLGNDGTAFTGNMEMAFSVLADMDTSDTATYNVTVGNGTKVVDIFAPRTYFSCFLAC